jgi:DNA processing protein
LEDFIAGQQHPNLDEQAALIALLRAKPEGLSWSELTARLLACGSAEKVQADLTAGELFVSPEHQNALAEARALVEEWRDERFEFITILDERYPASVREIHQAPPFLFAAGELRVSDPAVSVVGSRKASERGLSIARGLAQALVERDISVIAGLALGIDTAAHTAALDAGGRTVALIATGIRKQYPAENANLHRRIAETGLVLSQFWPDAPPQKHTFLMRNATMSGYGLATIVVEAGEHSGARAQARMAVEHGRPVILTDLVVQSTQWGKSYVGRPGVSVASSVSAAMQIVDQIREETSKIDTALGELVAV